MPSVPNVSISIASPLAIVTVTRRRFCGARAAGRARHRGSATPTVTTSRSPYGRCESLTDDRTARDRLRRTLPSARSPGPTTLRVVARARTVTPVDHLESSSRRAVDRRPHPHHPNPRCLELHRQRGGRHLDGFEAERRLHLPGVRWNSRRPAARLAGRSPLTPRRWPSDSAYPRTHARRTSTVSGGSPTISSSGGRFCNSIGMRSARSTTRSPATTSQSRPRCRSTGSSARSCGTEKRHQITRSRGAHAPVGRRRATSSRSRVRSCSASRFALDGAIEDQRDLPVSSETTIATESFSSVTPRAAR